MGKYNDKMEFVGLVDATGVEGVYPGHIALGVCIFGGSVIDADFTVEDTIGHENKIKSAFGLTASEESEETIKNSDSKEIKPKDIDVVKSIKMKNVNTGKTVKEFKSVIEMKDFLNISRGKAYDIIREKRNVDGFFYTRNDEEVYVEKDRTKNERKVRKYNLKHYISKEEVLNVSVKEICKITKATPTTVYRIIKEGRRSRNGWYVCDIS